MNGQALPYFMLSAPVEITDPGTGTAITVDRTPMVLPLTIAASASETNTLAAPNGPGREILIMAASVGSGGTRTITVASTLNADGDTTLVFDAQYDYAILKSFPVGSGTYKWRLVASEGITGAVQDLTVDGLTVTGNAAITGTATVTGTAYIGDSANANVTLGLTINQGAADDNVLCCKSSDVATGLTTAVTGSVETDDYLVVQKFAAATGGATIQALGENAAVTTNLRIESYGGQASTTHTSAGRALVEVVAHQHDGSNGLSAVTADGNVFAIRANQGGSETTVWMIDEDGAPQSIVDHAAFDEHDDIALLRGFDVVRTGGAYGFVKSKFDEHLKHNEKQLVDIGVLGAPLKEGGLLNMKRLAMVQNGAIYQLFEDLMSVAEALPEESRAKLSGRVQQRLAALPAN